MKGAWHLFALFAPTLAADRARLTDTGPLVALFDPKDGEHDWAVEILKAMREPMVTTVPVLTEAFHMLGPSSQGSDRLRDFVLARGVFVRFLAIETLERAFELMEQYANQPMDLADASLVAIAEEIPSRKIFTLDRSDFETYRVKRGHRHVRFDIQS